MAGRRNATAKTRELPASQRSPRRRHREIIAAAAVVFRKQGYDATTIQDIADAVGILKGSLYYYIDSKEDLLFEILQSVHMAALKNIELAASVDGDALQKIRAFVLLHLRFNAENLVEMGVFFQDFRSLSDERRQVIVEERAQYDGFLRGLIREGQTQRIICPDIDAKLASLSILGMTNWIYQWYDPKGERSADEVAEAFADMVVAGLACTPETHGRGHRSKLAAVTVSAPPDAASTKAAPRKPRARKSAAR